MNLKIMYLDVLNTPLGVLFAKFMGLVKSKISDYLQFKKDRLESSFLSHSEWTLLDKSVHLISIDDFNISIQESSLLERYTSFSMNHRFDILGSGWRNWGYFELTNEDNENEHGKNILDKDGNWLNLIVNKNNLPISKSIWIKIQSLNSNYEPIDWQKNVINGFRYSSKDWFKNKIKENKALSSDIKIPWEMSRLQHFIRMLVYSRLKDENAEAIIKEVQCQLLDFIMSNPPRWGVNWRSTMEVSIRAANMAFVLHLLSQQGEIDDEVKDIISKSIHEHLIFIDRYDESKNGLGNNHYLSNLAGFLCAASIFKSNHFLQSEIERKGRSLLKEINKQFLMDGGNFESSTAYHCLSLEMCIYGMFMIQFHKSQGTAFSSLDQQLYDKSNTRLFKAGTLLKNMIRNDESIPQFGDNDSARFFKVGFEGKIMSFEDAKKLYSNLEDSDGVIDKDDKYLDEDMLNYSSCTDILNAYFGTHNPNSRRALLSNSKSFNGIEFGTKDEKRLTYNKVKMESLKYEKRSQYRPSTEQNLNMKSGLSQHLYPATGFYIFKGNHFHLMINGSNRHVKQYWPHGHNDKLSFDLYIEGKPISRDPGSFTYTGDVDLRNIYRSEIAHNVPIHHNNQNLWPKGREGVFRLINKSTVEIIDYSEDGITLLLIMGDIKHFREWKILENSIEVIDRSNHDFELNDPIIAFSPGYGKRLAIST